MKTGDIVIYENPGKYRVLARVCDVNALVTVDDIGILESYSSTTTVLSSYFAIDGNNNIILNCGQIECDSVEQFRRDYPEYAI